MTDVCPRTGFPFDYQNNACVNASEAVFFDDLSDVDPSLLQCQFIVIDRVADSSVPCIAKSKASLLLFSVTSKDRLVLSHPRSIIPKDIYSVSFDNDGHTWRLYIPGNTRVKVTIRESTHTKRSGKLHDFVFSAGKERYLFFYANTHSFEITRA